MWLALVPSVLASPLPVVGGEPAPSGRWPDAVALHGIGGAVTCSGVLIAPDLVLTAGHCAAALQDVVVGTTDLRSGGRAVGIDQVIVHDRPYDTLDVALIVLSEPVTDLPPRQLVRDCLVYGLTDGAEVAIVGFGATDQAATEFPDLLMEAFTTVRDADCSDLATGCFPEVSPGSELVAGGSGVDSCAGDSGGPLYLVGGDEDWLAGITSRAAQPAAHPCGDGGIYVRADAIAAWVEGLGFALPHPSCDGVNFPPAAEARPLTLARGAIGVAPVRVTDGNPDDGHVVEIVDEGRVAAWTQEGWLVARAPRDWSGRTSVKLRVTDDGDPPLSTDLEVPVTVVAPEPLAGGCGTVAPSPRGFGWALPALLVAARRRRCSR